MNAVYDHMTHKINYQNSATPHEIQIYSSAPYNAQLNNIHYTNYKQFKYNSPLFNNRNNFNQGQRISPKEYRVIIYITIKYL